HAYQHSSMIGSKLWIKDERSCFFFSDYNNRPIEFDKMAGHLCLKWNNHSSAFVHSLSSIQTKEKYCDATIICQGQYFSVHRVVLSTCSEYFEDMFERIQCQHPYIVFKDIEPNEMELLLNYMYQGEVNVIQDSLPNLIKAAEALKIKGLAVPDDIPSGKESSSRKRANQNSDSSVPKRRAEERKTKISHDKSEISEQHQNNNPDLQDTVFDNLEKPIKQEPEEYIDFVSSKVREPSGENQSGFSKEEDVFAEVPAVDLKEESHLPQPKSDVPASSTDDFEDQSLNWNEFSNCNEEDISSDIPNQDANHENFFESLPLVLSDFTSIVNQRFFSTTNTNNSTTTTSNSTSTSTTATTSRVMDRSHQCPFCLFKTYWGEAPWLPNVQLPVRVCFRPSAPSLHPHRREHFFMPILFAKIQEQKLLLKIHIYKTKIFQSNLSSLNSQLASDFASSSQECVGEYSTSDQSSNQESLTYLGTNFQCSMCSYNCDSVKELRQHIRFYHMDSKSYSCPFCNKVFITKQHIQRHVLIHTGEKPYTCPRCLKGFRFKNLVIEVFYLNTLSITNTGFVRFDARSQLEFHANAVFIYK
ncbi:Sex determination protein fruitless, partial [Armadillidium vulgare]